MVRIGHTRIGHTARYQRTYQHEHHDGEYPQFQHGMPENRIARFWQLGYFCRENQDPSDYRNQRHHEERLGDEPTLTKRHLDRIEQLDDKIFDRRKSVHYCLPNWMGCVCLSFVHS